jgi:SAM-dependent methyltransferase
MADPPKNWDSLAALDCVLANTSKRARVLDAGSELYSRILPWLCLYGYKNLVGINLVFKEETKRGPITYKYGDITRTGYDQASFDAITCLSVLEHGVNVEAYFREMFRILKPGGVLITSTDYWQTPIDGKGQEMYGAPVHVFTQQEILQAIQLAERCGFALTAPIDLNCNEKVVHWEKVGLDYTLLIFTLRKSS